MKVREREGKRGKERKRERGKMRGTGDGFIDICGGGLTITFICGVRGRFRVVPVEMIDVETLNDGRRQFFSDAAFGRLDAVHLQQTANGESFITIFIAPLLLRLLLSGEVR